MHSHRIQTIAEVVACYHLTIGIRFIQMMEGSGDVEEIFIRTIMWVLQICIMRNDLLKVEGPEDTHDKEEMGGQVFRKD